jgi:hypothetical protein
MDRRTDYQHENPMDPRRSYLVPLFVTKREWSCYKRHQNPMNPRSSLTWICHPPGVQLHQCWHKLLCIRWTDELTTNIKTLWTQEVARHGFVIHQECNCTNVGISCYVSDGQTNWQPTSKPYSRLTWICHPPGVQSHQCWHKLLCHGRTDGLRPKRLSVLCTKISCSLELIFWLRTKHRWTGCWGSQMSIYSATLDPTQRYAQ